MLASPATRSRRSPLRPDVSQSATESGSKPARKQPTAKKSDTPTTLLIIFLACLATLLCYKLALKKYGSGLRGTVVAELQTLLPDTQVFVGSVSSLDPNTIELANVKIATRGQRKPVFTAERIVLRGELDIADWAQQTTRVREVHLHGARLSLWWEQEAARWSAEILKPRKKAGSPPPPDVVIHSSTVQLFADESHQNSPLVVHNIEGSVRSTNQENCQHTLLLTGESSGLLNRVQIAGSLCSDSHAWKIGGLVERLNFGKSLLDQLPPEIASKVSTQLAGLDCILHATFEAYSTETGVPAFTVDGSIESGRLRDSRLPYPLEEANGQFHCDNNIFTITDLNAHSGAAALSLNANIFGFGASSPIEIRARASNLELDGRLYASLPQKLQGAWDKLRPSGRVSGKIVLSFDGAKWKPSCTMQCDGVSLQPWLFPYPLRDIYGPVQYADGTASSIGLRGTAGGQPVKASFSLTKQGEEWFGRLEGNALAPVVIDEQLISALTPRNTIKSSAELFVRSLEPAGAIELKSFSFSRASPTAPRWDRVLDAHVYDARIRYTNFAYPIYDIRGRIFARNDNWQLSKFEGRNDSGRILCSGSWNSGHPNTPMDIRFDAFSLPLGEALFAALPRETQDVWRELRPQGSIDQVYMSLRRNETSPELLTEVVIHEQADDNIASGRSLRLHPKSFPYRLHDAECHVRYTPGLVEIYRAAGQNRSSSIALAGNCTPQADGRWEASVKWLPATNLMVDPELLSALPEAIRNSLLKIDFSGPISVLGTSRIKFPNADFPNPISAWDCQLDVEDAMLASGKTVSNMRGTIYMRGSSDGHHVRGSGRVEMDSLKILDVPVSSLQGPFLVLNNTLYFGNQVQQNFPAAEPPVNSQMKARALAGELLLEGTGQLDSGKFEISSRLQDAELSSLLQDVGVNRASTQAKCNATIKFSGVPWTPQTWLGGGNIQLTDAQLFQLPFMMRLLRVASVNAKDDSAFQRASIDFDISGDQIPLRIACDGDLVRLKGDGKTTLRRDIELTLHMSVGRRIPLSSVLSPIVPESQLATLMTIEVDGTLDNFEMHRRQFPQLASIQELFPELDTTQTQQQKPETWSR